MTIAAVAKQAVSRLLPRLRTWHQKRHAHRFDERMGLPRITQAWTARHGLRVLDGPFAGMEYVPQAVGSVLVPKLLGSYESELHPILNTLLQTPYAAVVDVGCAEGYYAVGMARRLPQTQVFAFDINAQAQTLCRDMAKANGVQSRVQVEGSCDPPRLQALLTQFAPCLIVCDCEGYEFSLLKPSQTPALRGADLLVELHPSAEHDVPILFKAFAATHDCTLIASTSRDPLAFAALECIAPSDRSNAVSEFRFAGQQWAVLKARNRSLLS